MKIWNVESKWSEERIIAPSITAARLKYLRIAKKEIAKVDPSIHVSAEPTAISLVGEAK